MGTRTGWTARTIYCGVALLALVLAGDTVGQEIDCSAEFDAGRVLVRFKPSVTALAEQSAHATAGALEVLKHIQGVEGLQLVRVAVGQEQAAVTAYLADSNVESASPDYLIRFDSEPDDAYYTSHQLWGMDNAGQVFCYPPGCDGCEGCPDSGVPGADINAKEAWDVWQGPASGNFAVAVIDNGVKYDHVDLYRNAWINQGEIPAWLLDPQNPSHLIDTDGDLLISFSDLNHADNSGKVTNSNNNNYIDAGDLLQLTGNGGWADGVNNDANDGNAQTDDIVGWDFADGDRDPAPVTGGDGSDVAGHGTHVAGIIAGQGNNTIGVVGVMWRARIVPLRYGTVCGTTSGAIAAIQYCIENNIKIINASWGTEVACPALATILNGAAQHGILVVAAAGNKNRDNDTTPFYPSSYEFPNIIAVAGTDHEDQRTLSTNPDQPGSNYGDTSVDLGAPGKNIWSTDVSGTPTLQYYKFRTGTSMAAPHVAGVAGLLWSRVPTLTYSEVRQQILDTVRPVAAMNGKTVTGGVVDAYRALLWDCDGNCSDPRCQLAQDCPGCPDCNGNGILDGCDIAAGTSCDRNSDDLPDECGACCSEEGACATTTQAACDDNRTFAVGVQCSACSCALTRCCLPGEALCQNTTFCGCLAGAGHSVGFGACGSCSTGVCCESDGGCYAASGPSSCATGDTYVGGATCLTFSCPQPIPSGQCREDNACPSGQGCCCDGTCGTGCCVSISRCSSGEHCCYDGTCVPSNYLCCTADSDCPPGLLCCGGQCKEGCDDGQCGLRYRRANRYIPIRVPASIGGNTAIRVRLTDLDYPGHCSGDPDRTCVNASDCDTGQTCVFLEGSYRYVNRMPALPGRCVDWLDKRRSYSSTATCETHEDCGGLGSYSFCRFNLCEDSPTDNTWFGCARLGCTPEYRDWATEFQGGPIHVTGDAIIPSSTYDVSILPSSCAGNEEACGNALCANTLSTSRWGDVDDSDPAHNPSAVDIGYVVSKVKDAVGAWRKPLTQLREDFPNPLALVGAMDISRIVDAVGGIAYPFKITSCDSSVLCNSVSCLEEGVPDISKCEPGQTCVNGFCRDECGRCAAQ